MTDTPVIVAGGGLAGAAAAAALARAGAAVTVIERENEPKHKICGEFLSSEAQAYLARLGVDLAPLGGHMISQLRLIRGSKIVTTALPFHGLGLSRRALDEAVLNHAVACGAVLHRGHAVQKINAGDCLTLNVAGIGTLQPKMLLLATGKHEVHGQRRAANPLDLVGFKMYVRLTPRQQAALTGNVELIMFRGGYAGLQLVENQQANLCLLSDRARLRRAGGTWEGLLIDLCNTSPHLAERLDGAMPLLKAPLTIARVPYGFLYRPPASDSTRLFRLGDQAGVIQSFTGDGMSIALHSAALAARACLRNDTSAVYYRRLARDIGGQIRRASILYRVAESSFAQPVLFAAAQIWPAALAVAARLTRIPAWALVS